MARWICVILLFMLTTLTTLFCLWNMHLLQIYIKKQKRKYQNRRWWVRPCNRRRYIEGSFTVVFLKYKYTDHEKFFNLTRLTVDLFDELLEIVGPHLQKASYREFLSLEFRLAFTICYLASENSLPSLANYWQIGKSTAYNIVQETCRVISNTIGATYLLPPNQQEYREIADKFWQRWNLPNCIGALDGKHIRIQCPANTGSQFFNYKQYFSIVLMATCDANYCFTSIHIGDYGDEIFPLHHNLMRPYSKRNPLTETQRIFNCRHSRARRVIENAFGILSTRWRVLRTSLAQLPESIENIVYATVSLHNFIMKKEEHQQGFKKYCPSAYVDQEDDNRIMIPGEWRRDAAAPNIQNLHRIGANHAAVAAVNLRNTLADYLTNHEEGPWQRMVVFRGYNINVP